MLVKLLGAHNTESSTTRMSGLLIDGTLALDAGSLTSSLTFEEQLHLRALLLTHQHYDHIRDIPALAINMYLQRSTFDIYTTAPVADIITSRLFDGSIYTDYLHNPPGNPTLKLNVIEPLQPFSIGDYHVLAIPVLHSKPTVGFQVTSGEGKTVFYTGDTGPGLAECWGMISPHLLVIEVTASNQYASFTRDSGHLTPGQLKDELVSFRAIHGYLPRIVTVHMSPALEEEISTELASIASELDADVSPGYEGMEINL